MPRHIRLCIIVALCLGPSLEAQDKFLGRTANNWIYELKNGDAKQRRNAAFALGKMAKHGDANIGELRAVYAKEQDAKVKDALLHALGELTRDHDRKDQAELERLFIAALKDADPYVKRSAAFALGCLRPRSRPTQLALSAAAVDESAIVRQNAIWALTQYHDDALAVFGTGLRDRDSLVKREAASALLQVKDGDKVHEYVKDLLPLCRDANSEVRRAALSVLVRIVDPSDKEAIPNLRWVLEDRDPEIRLNAALALTNIGGEESATALPVLLQGIKSASPDLRRQAVLGVGNVGPRAASALGELTRVLRDDTDAKMREHAAVSIGGIGKASEKAVPLLIDKIKDDGEDQDVRVKSAMALAHIGPVPAAKEAVPALLEVLADRQKDPKVRERIVWALRVHGAGLRGMKGVEGAFTQILKEPKTEENRMVRFDCAYMLGMIWQAQAPDVTLDVLTEFLRDPNVKVYIKTDTLVKGGTIETGVSQGGVKDQGEGDGRVMATDALKMMGYFRYSNRGPLMQQLRDLSQDMKLYPPLRKSAQELLKAQ